MCVLMVPARPEGQQNQACRFLCAPEFLVEPTLTVTNLVRPARIIDDDGGEAKEAREIEFELILANAAHVKNVDLGGAQPVALVGHALGAKGK